MKISSMRDRFFRGLGDVISLSFIGEAAKDGPDPITFVANGQRAELYKLFGQTVTEDDSNSYTAHESYLDELNDLARKPRLQYVLDGLKIKTGWKHPTVNLTDEMKFAAEVHKRQIVGPRKKKLILCFPQTHWAAREYPAMYWVHLTNILEKMGFAVAVMCGKPDEKFFGIKHNYYECKLEHIAALMTKADLVIANDSMPSHMAGALNVPCLALMGPTPPTVFAHCPSVECLYSEKLGCERCSFASGNRGPYQSACRTGCMSLYQLMPETVAEIAVARLH